MTRTLRTITKLFVFSTLLLGAQAACPAPLLACGDACYSETQYCCPNGRLTQKAFCPSATSQQPATSAASACVQPTIVQQSSCASSNPARDPQCCVGDGTGYSNGTFCGTRHQCLGGTCFLTGVDGENCGPATPATSSASAAATQQSTSNCPSTLSSCGDACYDPAFYCCPNGQLTQKQFCPTSSATSTQASSSCVPVKFVSEPNCANSNPSRDLHCCMGNGIALANGSYCGTEHQCLSGICFLTGKDGENCPYYTASSSSSVEAASQVCTPANVVQQDSCNYNNPARDLQCCVGNGTGLQDGAYCGTLHQCFNGYCGLTGSPGANCPSTSVPTTTSAAVSDASSSSCVPIKFMPEPNCANSNPARDLHCCMGNGIALANGSYCGTEHQCFNGYCGLTGGQGQNCPYVTSSSSSSSSSVEALSQTCTPVTIVKQDSCNYNNPAIDYTCCVGNGTGVQDGAFCGTQHQCFNGYCGLTGSPGENCPYSTTPSTTSSASVNTASAATNICAGKCGGASCCATARGSLCYDQATHVCGADDLGNYNVCATGYKSCGQACYSPSQYHCKSGNLVYGQ